MENLKRIGQMSEQSEGASDKEQAYYFKLRNMIRNKQYEHIVADLAIIISTDDKKRINNVTVNSLKTLSGSRLIKELVKLNSEQIAGLILYLHNGKPSIKTLAPKIFGAIILADPGRTKFISDKFGPKKSEIQVAWMALNYKDEVLEKVEPWVDRDRDPLVIAKDIIAEYQSNSVFSVEYAADHVYMLCKLDKEKGYGTMTELQHLDEKFGSSVMDQVAQLNNSEHNGTSALY